MLLGNDPTRFDSQAIDRTRFRGHVDDIDHRKPPPYQIVSDKESKEKSGYPEVPGSLL